MKPKVWSKKTSFSSCFILGALELHFVPFPFYVYMRLDTCIVCVLLGVFLGSTLVWQQSGNHFSTKSSKQLHLGGILRAYLILTAGLGP